MMVLAVPYHHSWDCHRMAARHEDSRPDRGELTFWQIPMSADSISYF